MKNVIKYKFYSLFTSKIILISVICLIAIINFHSLFSSGILLSGGKYFNSELKYELILNNYLLVSSMYGLLFSAFLGSSIVGPDLQTGNIHIILTSYASRKFYYLGTFFAVFAFVAGVQAIIFTNVILLFFIFDVSFLISEVFYCFIQVLLNGFIVLSVTGIASIYMQGNKSAAVGLLCYGYFNIYTYNIIPFINTSFIFDVSEYRNILCNFAPIVHILPASYTPEHIIELYKICPLIPNVWCYQMLYGFGCVLIGMMCFQQCDL